MSDNRTHAQVEQGRRTATDDKRHMGEIRRASSAATRRAGK